MNIGLIFMVVGFILVIGGIISIPFNIVDEQERVGNGKL